MIVAGEDLRLRRDGQLSICMFKPGETDDAAISRVTALLIAKAAGDGLINIRLSDPKILPATHGTAETGTLWPRRALVTVRACRPKPETA
jgi:hypothetical protein